MKRIRWIPVCAVALIAMAFLFGAYAEQEDPLRFVRLSGDTYSFSYTPSANGDYSVCIWSIESEPVTAKAALLDGEDIIASGDGAGTVCSAWLAADRTYTVTVEGEGRIAVEVARNALSRCHDNAMQVSENDRKGKMIAHSGDAHWYSFTATEDSFLMLVCEPEEARLNLGALLMDDRGKLVSEFDTLAGGACMLRIETEKDREYYVRVHSPEGSTGYYSFSIYRTDGLFYSEVPAFDSESYSVSRNHTIDLSKHLTGNIYFYTVSDPNVCGVSPDGILTGIGEGTAVVTAYGFSSQTQCKVNVENIPIRSIEILGNGITIKRGNDADIPIVILPENASSGLLIYTVEDPEIASVSDEGVVTGLKVGTTILHVATGNGRISDTVKVTVEEAPRRYRALLVGEENYPESVNEPRPGALYAVNAIAGMLGTMNDNGERFITTQLADASKTELIREIRETFSGVLEQDISLIYISCHGKYQQGVCCIQLTDGTMLPVQVIEQELRKIPGTIVVMLDFCYSGGSIGIGEEGALFANRLNDTFANSVFPSSKYLVLCSTTLNRESYRPLLNGAAEMVPVFARALCDAAGWDIDSNTRSAMQADSDIDRKISFSELYDCVLQRVDDYMKSIRADYGNGYVQNVCSNAPSDPLILFSR